MCLPPVHMSQLSVVIPAYNEEELLPHCLRALQLPAKRLGVKIYVIDNNSTDQTAAIARKFGATVISEPRQGVVYALQRGLLAVSTALVAFTDADSVVAPNWLDHLLEDFQNPKVLAVTGPIQFQNMRLLSWSRWFYRRILLGSNMAVRRQTALAVGGFNPEYNLASDVAFGWAIQRHGEILFDRRMIVTTSARRFQAQPYSQGARYVLNHVWMVVFHRPLFWSFRNIRRSRAELERLAQRRLRWTVALLTLITVAYLSWWPTATDFGQVMVRGDDDKQLVALTFDDGPNGQATRQIVDILHQAQVPATFFEVGRSIAADPATARYVTSHGFSIGNHSWNHSFRLPYFSPSHIADDLRNTSQEIFRVTGTQPVYFRPPHGLRSPQLLYEADHQQLRLVDWSVDPRDYLLVTASTIVHRVVNHTRSGSIILLHDGVQDGPAAGQVRNRQSTITALPVIIANLRQRGFTFVTLDQLLPKEHEGRSS